jgi:hypothetical protein
MEDIGVNRVIAEQREEELKRGKKRKGTKTRGT